uniref:FAS1 domain-containing protein n=1 Tax=Glossina palpalis gambiensis TaxID=67801 RepID=A0A1B0C3L4_9MUSC
MVQTSWLCSLRKEELSDICGSLDLDTKGTVEEVRKAMTALIATPELTTELKAKLTELEAKYAPRMLQLPEGTVQGASPKCQAQEHISCGAAMDSISVARSCIECILIPPKMNLLEMLQNNPNYSKFLELVQAANLTDLLVNPEENYTLLVPKNDVFEELDEKVTKEPTELESLIKTHIVNDVICCAGIIPTNWPFVRSIESLNGHHLRITQDRRPKIQNAGITKCDAMATNGIIHEMNDIVVPSSRQSQQPQRPHQHFSRHPQEDIFSDLFL